MKFYNYLHIFLVIFGLSFVACKKQDIPVKPQSSAFSATVEGDVKSFSAAGGTGNIIVTAGEMGWSITSSQNNWLVINKVFGAGNFKIPITIKANTTGVDRVVQVSIKPTFNQPTTVITINQTK